MTYKTISFSHTAPNMPVSGIKNRPAFMKQKKSQNNGAGVEA